MLSTENK